MLIPSSEMVREELVNNGAEVHSVHVSANRSIVVYDASYGAHKGEVPNIPVLFAMLCVGGGGRVVQKTNLQHIDAQIDQGSIGIVPPNSAGFGQWPEIRVIGLGIEVSTIKEGFGEKWPQRLSYDVISKPFRDPLVEATMMQIGYTQAGRVSDNVLKYAAQMIVHQLLDEPFQKNFQELDLENIKPLADSALRSIEQYILENIDRQIQVQELAELCNISQHHFSRRFKAAAGISPYQYVLQKKLDVGADALLADDSKSIIDVAQSVGFENPAQFAKAFRRRFGQPPRFWRSARS
ncbi:MAG: AraC family transcriptional regulator [Pseudomonadota bacterium]